MLGQAGLGVRQLERDLLDAPQDFVSAVRELGIRVYLADQEE